MADKLRLVTEEEGTLLTLKAKEWIETGPGAFMFCNARAVAQLAIMEFLANEQGLSIYPAVIERQEKEDGSS